MNNSKDFWLEFSKKIFLLASFHRILLVTLSVTKIYQICSMINVSYYSTVCLLVARGVEIFSMCNVRNKC